MSEVLQVLILGGVIYGMKLLPFMWRIVPRSPRIDAALDLMPAGLMTALIFPSAFLGAASEEILPALLVIAAVIASVLVSLRSNKPALGILTGLALLAIAELI